MKRPYQPPQLTEYGSVNQLTLGSSGPKSDIVIIIDMRAPSVSISTSPSGCTNNLPGSATGCFTPIIKW